MNQMRHRTGRRAAMAALLLSILAVVPAPHGASQPPEGTQPEAAEQQRAARKPIPRSWKIAIAATAMVASLVVLAFSARAWRAGNLFDREYRFPSVASVAIRLGATRSGGCMATITFRDRGDPPAKPT